MTTEDKSDIVKHLLELGSCLRCIIRFTDEKNVSDYKDLNVYYEKIDKNICKNADGMLDEGHKKKAKFSPCRVCLDIFQDGTLDDIAARIKSSSVSEYRTDDFQLVISFPKTVFVRSHSMFIYLKEKFPGFYKDWELKPLNKLFRICITEKVVSILNRKYDQNSTLEVNVHMAYNQDEEDVQNMIHFNGFPKKTKKNHYGKSTISKGCIQNLLESVDDSTFKKHFPVPPNIPSNSAEVKDIICCNAALFIGGRYLKFSRNMGQTPWIIDNKKVTEHCVQDVIFESLRKVLWFSDNKLTFCASGREDANVRMLGDGRPFYIQVDDPKDQNIPLEKFKEIENEISKSNLVAVQDLQIVKKSDLHYIKQGEEHKRKTYEALCKTTAPDIEKVVELINCYKSIEINQRTPIRVLHRRTQAIRKKQIYDMKASVVPGHNDLFILECITQAGTYVKEFVHGDFERTVPNLGTIIGYQVDIVALDVTKIHLNWPNFEEERM